jgi:hypothetical protein
MHNTRWGTGVTSGQQGRAQSQSGESESNDCTNALHQSACTCPQCTPRVPAASRKCEGVTHRAPSPREAAGAPIHAYHGKRAPGPAQALRTMCRLRWHRLAGAAAWPPGVVTPLPARQGTSPGRAPGSTTPFTHTGACPGKSPAYPGPQKTCMLMLLPRAPHAPGACSGC